MRIRLRYLLAAVGCLAAWGIIFEPVTERGFSADDPPAPRSTAAPAFDPVSSEKAIPAQPGLENLVRHSPQFYTGGEPAGDEAFAALARLGVKTVVSVDGIRPDAEAARRHGLRYVHIPVGYEGVNEAAAAGLTRLVRESSGPFYIHCHHGKHRGPAAAAVACRAAGAADAEAARRMLEVSGTGANYAGLWRDVKNFRPLPADAKLPELREQAELKSLSQAMAHADRHFDHLKLCQGARWQAPEKHPDLVPRQEALLLAEAFRESLRQLEGEYDESFRRRLAESAEQADRLRALLTQPSESLDRAAAAGHMQALERQCRACHEKYRDNR